LPLDASDDFGNELNKEVIPYLIREDVDDIISRASETTLEGKLSEDFAYLDEYLKGVD